MNKKEIDFRRSDGLRTAWAAIMADGTTIRALEAVVSMPDSFPEPIPGAHPDTLLAREYSKSVGVNDTIKRLKLLCEKLPDGDPEKLMQEAAREQWLDGALESLPKDLQLIIKKHQESKS